MYDPVCSQELKDKLSRGARLFLQETRVWSSHWVNGRSDPLGQAPTALREAQIDALLNELLPDLFRNIKVGRVELTS